VTTPSYNNRRFVSVSNFPEGEVDSNTTFDYHQEDDVVWATYRGGSIAFGTLIAKVDKDGNLEMRYQHVPNEARDRRPIPRRRPCS
jgi:hypothetical protein